MLRNHMPWDGDVADKNGGKLHGSVDKEIQVAVSAQVCSAESEAPVHEVYGYAEQ